MADRVLYIKNMVCDRCVMVVRERLLALGLEVEAVELGRALLGRPAAGGDSLDARGGRLRAAR